MSPPNNSGVGAASMNPARNSTGFVTEKLCKSRYNNLKWGLGIGIPAIMLILIFILGYILNGESNRNESIQKQNEKITKMRIDVAVEQYKINNNDNCIDEIKADIKDIKADLKEIKEIKAILAELSKGR